MNGCRIVLSCLLLFPVVVGAGQISLPKLISDGAVLQREIELNIWGWASPGEPIQLLLGSNTYETTADQQGNWSITLPPQKAGGPFEMVFSASNSITLRNILFGDVWLCSGQSNMELTMQRVRDKYPDVIGASENAHIRQFLVPDTYDFLKEYGDFDSGSWISANPETIENFSAVAYFFAREIYDRYHVPIGLINAALGGSPVEAWMSEDALRKFPYAYEELQQFKDGNLIRQIEESDRARQQSWYRELHSEDAGLVKGAEWYFDNTPDENWKVMELPDFWANQEPGAIQGSVWFRKHIKIPPTMAGKEAKLWLGRIVDRDSVYVNGRFVGATGYQYPPRKYTIAANLLQEGNNTIVVRVINEQGKGGFIRDKPYFLAVGRDTIFLNGPWKYRLGTAMAPLESPTFIRWKAGGLYKRMIAPLLKFKIKGVIWYQGESNTPDPARYYDTFPALIKNWREKWQIGDFPFLFVQLANFMEETLQPAESNWAEIRQAQLTTLSVPNTGMAVAIDLGEWNDIHPLNKEDVGKRLALQALKLAYNDLENSASSPTPQSYRFSRKSVKIRFRDTDGGLVAKKGLPLHYFELSNDGKHFVKADAVIKGDWVIVRSSQVVNPSVARYAWADNPAKANLYSGKGLPASPFQIRKKNELR